MLIVDDHPIMRIGFAAIIQAHGEMNGGDFISLDAVEAVQQYQMKLTFNRHTGAVEEKKQ